MKKTFLAAASVFYAFFSPAQVFPPADYPRGYFRDPLNIPMSLAANFGELRPNHYHMGLDIRTQKRENLSVLAAADGVVVKVVIEPFGFGQAIYVRHPNGYTTVYAHLNAFFPALASYIHQQQYKIQSWQGTFDIPPGLFPVKKGSLIAYSGNRGGSQGPHLHFEIRRTADDTNLNPLLFGLPVPDNTSPVIQRLAIYDRERSMYEQSPLILPVHRAAAVRSPAARSPAARSPAARSPAARFPTVRFPALYAPPSGLIPVNSPRVSFAISAFDTQTGSANPNGIYQAILYDNDQPLIGFQMDNISYNDTRNINAHIDFKTRETGGPFLQHLSRLPGYTPPTIYRSAGGSPAGKETASLPYDGVIDLGDGARHSIRIEVKDAYGNVSELRYQVQYQASGSFRGLPTDPRKRFYPGMLDGYETADCAFYLGEKSLCDSVAITATVVGYPGSGHTLPGGMSETVKIGEPWIPLLEPMLVRLKSAPALQVDSIPGGHWTSLTSSIVMVCFQGQGAPSELQRPEWHDGWASARFHEFGSFQLVDDTIPPVITALGPLDGADLSQSARIAFTVKDNLGAVRNFRAELDGQWLCFTNDKGLAFVYSFDEHCPPGRHRLKVTVEDVAGNRATEEYNFTR